ncbi:MAG: MBL fold metallo-hydrolase [Anaerolineales bacterium]|jgi:L-ascorbate metabolism protein UlaG (beta-lactamase superfamily)
MNSALHFRWLGVGGIELETQGQTLLIDPFVTRPPFWLLFLGRPRPNRQLIEEKIPAGDFVLVSHAHYDHLMDVPEIVRYTGAISFGSPNTCHLLGVLAVPRARIVEIGLGHLLNFGKIKVSILPSQHMTVSGHEFAAGALRRNLRLPLRLRDYRMDFSLGFLIRAAGIRLLHTLSANPEFAAPADVLFVSAFHGEAFYRTLLQVVEPRLVVPIHWDDFFRPVTKPLKASLRPPRFVFPPTRRIRLDKFKQMLMQAFPQTKVLIPDVFRRYEVGANLGS